MTYNEKNYFQKQMIFSMFIRNFIKFWSIFQFIAAPEPKKIEPSNLRQIEDKIAPEFCGKFE